MLHNTHSEQSLQVGGISMKSSHAKKETKVSMHTLHALLGLITQQLGDYGCFIDEEFFCQGNIFSDPECPISEADIPPPPKSGGKGVCIDTSSSLPNTPVFNSFLASLGHQLTDLYLVTWIARGESHA